MSMTALKAAREALADSRKAIASLEPYTLGGVDVTDTQTGDVTGQYPIRDELLAKIDAALAALATHPADQNEPKVGT